MGSHLASFEIMTTKKDFLTYIFLTLVFLIQFKIEGNSQFVFKSLTVNDGLSQHDVSIILQDSYGYIWIGTYDGLNRFDGYNIENFSSLTNNPESLSGNRITSLFEDSQKRLWIGTDGEGLNYFDLRKERFVRVQTEQDYEVINDVIEDSKGNILVATSNGLLKIEQNDSIPELMNSPLTGYIIEKMTSTASGIYFATNSGIWRMKDDLIHRVELNEDRYITSITSDEEGKIWAGGFGFIFCITVDGDDLDLRKLSIEGNPEVISLSASGDNIIWAGTLNQGLYKLDGYEVRIIENLSKNNRYSDYIGNSIPSLYCDNSNTIWIANRKGVSYASLQPGNFRKIPLELDPSSAQNIQALLYHKDNIYVGLQSGVFYMYNVKSQETVNLELPQNIFPIKFYNFDDKIYLTSNRGVFYAEENSKYFRPLSVLPDQVQNVFSMCRDHKGNFYYGTYTGLIINTEEGAGWAHNLYEQTKRLQNKRVFTLYFDQSSMSIWVGTISEGIYKINLNKEGEVRSVEPYDRSMANDYYIPNNAIWCFYMDRQENLWAGTDAGLILKKNGTNVFTHISTEGIIDKKIMGIVEDEQGKLWLSNSQGIIAFDPGSEIVNTYSFKDGLSTSTFTESVDTDEKGNLYFGSINGINVFNPSDIKQSEQINKVFFTGLKVHQKYVEPEAPLRGSIILAKSINETELIYLNYQQNNFSFEFAGKNIYDARENQFRYRLEGYNNDWILTDGKYNAANYSNLKPGEYTFIVEVANEDGVWSNDPKTIDLVITPAPWKTLWAFIIYIVVTLSLFALFLYFLYNRQKLRQKIHLDQLNHEKEQKIHNLKLEFFTDVAHEFKTPLSLIIGPLNDLMHKDLSREVKEFCYQVISRNTKRMMFLVNQLLDFRKISADINILNVREKNLSEFIYRTTEAFLWQAQDENIHLNIIVPKDFNCYFDASIMEKVLYNVLSNAFKYTPQNGIIELKVKPIWKDQVQYANIMVRDSGKGIPDEEKNKIFERFFHGKNRYSSGIGLHLSYTLIKAHKGEINVADSNYGGAEFVLTIPVSKESFAENELFDGEEMHKWPQDIFKLQKVQSKPVAPERERILIVEDDHDLRAYLKNSLQARYNLSEAANGLDGMKLAKKELPDIIITDVMMPEMDGMEMTRNLKETVETSHIPILMVTAKSDEEYQKNGLDSGAWDYITKPFNTDALLKKIDNIVETRNRYKTFLASQNITIDVQKHYTTYDQKIISKVVETMQKHLDDPDYSIEDLAMEIGLSRMQLHRKLKTLIGMTTSSFINSIRISHARNLFENGCDRIQEAMAEVGINSYSHFNKIFIKIVGESPSDYIKKQQKLAKL